MDRLNDFKDFFSSLFKTNNFKEVKDTDRCNNVKPFKEKKSFIKKIFNVENLSTVAVAASFYVLGKVVTRTQFAKSLFNCDFITPSVDGHSDICFIESMDDIKDNTIKLHKKGEMLEF